MAVATPGRTSVPSGFHFDMIPRAAAPGSCRWTEKAGLRGSTHQAGPSQLRVQLGGIGRQRGLAPQPYQLLIQPYRQLRFAAVAEDRLLSKDVRICGHQRNVARTEQLQGRAGCRPARVQRACSMRIMPCMVALQTIPRTCLCWTDHGYASQAGWHRSNAEGADSTGHCWTWKSDQAGACTRAQTKNTRGAYLGYKTQPSRPLFAWSMSMLYSRYSRPSF